jgi:glycine/D-amino acid oxidase-like deaminating enzyme
VIFLVFRQASGLKIQQQHHTLQIITKKAQQCRNSTQYRTRHNMTRQILPVPNPVTSYWLSEESPLADLRSTSHLPQECDVAVIGAGMAGVLSAYHILKSTENSGDHRSLDAEEGGATEYKDSPTVLLVDARQLCSGATGRNGGHVKVQVNTLLNLPDSDDDGGSKRTAFQDYVGRVMLELKRIVEDEDLDCEFELRRSFDVFTDVAQASKIYTKYNTARKAGEPWTTKVSWISAARAAQLTSITHAAGAFSVPAASFWPYKFVTGLLARMLARWPRRLNVQMQTPILSLSSSSIPLLTTDRGRIIAAKVVLATNAYTAGLLPRFKDKIVPVRGMASHHRPEKRVHPHLSNTYNINFGPGKGVDYLNPRPDGGVVVGGGSWLFAQDVASWRDNFDDAHLFPERTMAYWSEYMQERFLGWEDSRNVNDYVWTGIMGRTSDGQPLVGRVPGKGSVWVLAGFNGGGMALIAVAARAMGSMVSENKGFEQVWEGQGLLREFECSEERLERL